MKKLSLLTMQVFFAALTGTLITRWVISSGFAGSVVNDGLANKIFRWILNALDIVGWEDAEMFMIVAVWCPTTLLALTVIRLFLKTLPDANRPTPIK